MCLHNSLLTCYNTLNAGTKPPLPRIDGEHQPRGGGDNPGNFSDYPAALETRLCSHLFIGSHSSDNPRHPKAIGRRRGPKTAYG